MTSSHIEKPTNKFQLKAIWILVGIGFSILFLSSSLRHGLFQSSAWDLGIFDQAVYLISQGQSPISSFLGFHILGDHVALILYPISILYRIYPDVHWLLMVQAFALALGIYLIFELALLAGLTSFQGIVVGVAYLLYPAIFNINLFDFHPEVIALPSTLWMILAARSRWLRQFCVALAITLSCKAVLSLTVAAMGLWLIVVEKRKWYGIIALASGIGWFIIATQIIIPAFGSEASIVRHVVRYKDLGNSFSDILLNILTEPYMLLNHVFSVGTLEYLVLLFSPVIYIFATKNLRPLLQLIPAAPALVMNILSSESAQRDLVHQYSLPIVPFVFLVVISYLQSTPSLHKLINYRGYRMILCWAVLAFLILSRLSFFFGSYYNSIDTLQSTSEAIAKIHSNESVLTTAEIAPHLTHRSSINFTNTDSSKNVDKFRYVLLNTRHPGWMSSKQIATDLVNQLSNDKQFQLNYQKDDVYLFVRN